MEPQQTDILIIGAGLTGLTTGFWLTRAGKDIHILEKADRVGGQIHTFREKDFVYESGPNTGVVSYPEVAELFEALSPALCTGDCPRRIQAPADLEREPVPGSPVRTVQCGHDSSVHAWRQVPYPRRAVSGKRQ